VFITDKSVGESGGQVNLVDLPDVPEVSLLLDDSTTDDVVAELQSFLFGFE
jgi:hypothetical protein